MSNPSRAGRTVKVAAVLHDANTRLSAPDRATSHLDGLTPQQAFRAGVASLLERVLHSSGNYAGFGYVEYPFVAGETDETRRIYYPHARIRADLGGAVSDSA